MKKLLAVLVFLVLLATVGCGGSKNEKNEYKAVLKDELVVGTEAAFAPFEFADEKTGKLTGFDVELIQAVAQEIGFKKCTVVNMDAISAVTINDTRKRVVLFTQPYYKSGLAFIVRKGITDVKTFEDLKAKTIAVQKETTGEVYARQLEEKGAVIKAFASNEQAFTELKNGKADAVVCDLPVLQYFLKNGGSAFASLAGNPLTVEEYGILMGKKKPDMQKAMDKALDNLKRNGTYDKLYEKWFGKGEK